LHITNVYADILQLATHTYIGKSKFRCQ